MSLCWNVGVFFVCVFQWYFEFKLLSYNILVRESRLTPPEKLQERTWDPAWNYVILYINKFVHVAVLKCGNVFVCVFQWYLELKLLSCNILVRESRLTPPEKLQERTWDPAWNYVILYINKFVHVAVLKRGSVFVCFFFQGYLEFKLFSCNILVRESRLTPLEKLQEWPWDPAWNYIIYINKFVHVLCWNVGVFSFVLFNGT